MKLIIICSLLVITNAQVDLDKSFQHMCKSLEGTYKPRVNQASHTGDKCVIKFPEATDSNVTARFYCEETVPFHITKATFGEYTECEAEATLICKDQWVQMFGRCYKIWKTLMGRNEAEKHCKANGATIAFMHREAFPFRIKEYFSRVSRIWFDASEAITKDLIHNVEGGHLILAIDGYNYNLPNVALARVKPDEKAMVLCEYTPPMTQAESTYLLKKFGEIYYPTVETSDGCYVRTSSSLNRNINDNSADSAYCTKVLRPFIHGGKSSTAYPSQEFMDKLKAMNIGGIVRTSAFSAKANDNDRKKKTCVNDGNPFFQIVVNGPKGSSVPLRIQASQFRRNEPSGMCDAASYSSAIVLSRDGKQGLEAMSDARYAPIYCQSVVDTFAYGDCPKDFTAFDRKGTRQKWCHRWFSDKKTYPEAQEYCKTEYQGHVSGYGDLEELDKMMDLVKIKGEHGDTLIGAKRRAECERLGSNGNYIGHSTTPGDPCTRNLVFEWENGAAPNPPDFANNWGHAVEPNHGQPDESCIVVMNDNDHYLNVKNRGLLNDHMCTTKSFNFFCGMEAPIVKV